MENEIIEGNKLIAKFMGLNISDFYNNPAWINNQGHWICEVGKEKYHLSWDWLMPIVEKIEKDFTVIIIRYSDELCYICEIETASDDPLQIAYVEGYDYHNKTKISVVYDAVIEFIKWYNNNKKK